MCSMKGSASGPSSATMNGTRWLIRPAMNATSRLSRSRFATSTGQRRRQLRPAIQRVGPFAGLDLDPLGHDREALGRAEPSKGGLLRLKPQARAALPGGGDADVGEGGL